MKKLFSFLLIAVLIACSKDPVIYTLTATANPAEGGTVSPSTQQYDSGDVATVTATASAEYVFQSWSGSASGSSPSTTPKTGDPNGNCPEKAWRWEWNGSSFTKIN